MKITAAAAITDDYMDFDYRSRICSKYQNDLKRVWVDSPTEYCAWWEDPVVVKTLDCKVINPNNKPEGFLKKGDKYQYDLRGRFPQERPSAWRIPFLLDTHYDGNYTVSHLCHNDQCYNWEHHQLEPLDLNKARNGCPGGPHCHHKFKCIRPGPYYNK